MYLHGWISAETVVQRCYVKKVFLKISQSSQKNTCARVSFLLSCGPEACTFNKNETLARMFSCEFCDISKNTFFYRTRRGDCFCPDRWNVPKHFEYDKILYANWERKRDTAKTFKTFKIWPWAPPKEVTLIIGFFLALSSSKRSYSSYWIFFLSEMPLKSNMHLPLVQAPQFSG